MKVNKIILKLKKKIKLDSMKIGVVKITPVGTINIDENGTYDVTNYNEAIVETPMPSGELEINSNGQYDISNYETANVNCPTDLDWSAIGYSERPKYIDDGYNYAKKIKNTWNDNYVNISRKYYNNKDISLMPIVDVSKVTDANNCFTNSNLTKVEFNNCSSLLIANSMFNQCYSLKSVKLYNLNLIQNCSYMFNYCNSLDELYLDIKSNNILDVSYMFTSCGLLKNAPFFDTSKVTNFTQMYRFCNNLINVPIYNTSKATNMSNMFGNCYLLSNESLNNILQMCINATSYTGAKTLKQLGLSSTQATTCQGLSNYQAFLDAGWSTGY